MLGEIRRQQCSRAGTADVGAVLQGRFKLVELIGEGGMSRVYKAIDMRRVEAHSPNPFLAVKVLTIPFDHYFDSIKALDREADKLRSLTHPNIVRVIDVDRDGQTVFMTMEFLSGESLHDKLRPAKAATLRTNSSGTNRRCDRAGARVRASHGHRSRRPEAGQRDHHGRRRGQGHRLRHRAFLARPKEAGVDGEPGRQYGRRSVH